MIHMGLSTTLGDTISFGWLKRRKERKTRRIQAVQQAIKNEIAQKEKAALVERVSRYPLKQMSRTEIDKLPKGKDLDLKGCPIGTWFACSSSPLIPDVTVIGQTVAGLDMIAEQWGAGLSIPERGINRYRVQII
jgi:hypothetical protein